MRLVPVKQAQATILNARADKGLQRLTLATFKKDRSLTLRQCADGWELEERGFANATAPLAAGAAGKRAIKEAFKREFPRSNKLYLEQVGV